MITQKKKICIGLCGLTKAGKDFIAEMLTGDEFGGFKVYNLTELVLHPVAKERGVPEDRDGLRQLLTDLGNDANKRLFTYVNSDKQNRVVLPNVRIFSTIYFWKNSSYEFYLGYVQASDETRFRRYQARRRDIDPQVSSIGEFKKVVDEKDLTVNELGKILEKGEFDFTIDNNQDGLDHLVPQIKQVLHDIVKLPGEEVEEWSQNVKKGNYFS